MSAPSRRVHLVRSKTKARRKGAEHMKIVGCDLHTRGWPNLSHFRTGLPLDTSEGVVTSIVVLSLRSSDGLCQRGCGPRLSVPVGETRTEREPWRPHAESLCVGSFHQPLIQPRTATMILLCEHPDTSGCESAHHETNKGVQEAAHDSTNCS
jgi:hypothetical protein